MAKGKIKDQLLDHNYDGIQELDNDLPPWWLYMFYFTIGWAVVYIIYFHVLGVGELQQQEYQSELRAEAQRLEAITARQKASDTSPLTAFTDAENLAAGKEVYMLNCMACHGQYGEGTIGPNMTDEYWVHGGTMPEIVKTINVGVPAKGMISWKPILPSLQIKQVASYILSLQGTNPANGKAPEGKKVEPSDG